MWIRSLDSLAMQLLPGTEGATYPFWSADNGQVGFFADRKLKKISISGGAVTTLTRSELRCGRHLEPRWNHCLRIKSQRRLTARFLSGGRTASGDGSEYRTSRGDASLAGVSP